MITDNLLNTVYSKLKRVSVFKTLFIFVDIVSYNKKLSRTLPQSHLRHRYCKILMLITELNSNLKVL